jgi:hypothetical protein
MNTSSPVPAQRFDASTLAWLALLALAVAVYALGLGGQYIPSNGDELVYSHIARLTAASKQWLPLVSELDHMRNTKPPLLFWQGMLASDWGQHWSQAALRAPSLLYTLLTTGAILWSVQRITGNLRLPDQCARNLLAQSAHVLAAVGAPGWMPGQARHDSGRCMCLHDR